MNDADRLCRDPVMRQLVGGRAVKRGAASASAMGRFETAVLTGPENLAVLADLPGRWIDAVHDRCPLKSITLDMDSSEIRGSLGEISGTHYSGGTALWLQTLALLAAGDTVELQAYFRAADGYVAAEHTTFWGAKVG